MPEQIHTSPYLTTTQAAKRASLAPITLKKMRVQGGGPPFLVVGGRRVLYELDKFDTWIRSREYRSTSEYAEPRAAA